MPGPEVDPERHRLRRSASRAAARARRPSTRPTARCCRSCSPAAARRPGATARAACRPRDLAMNVALPEVDGRILTRAVSFKARGALRSGDRMPHRRLPAGAGPRRLRRRRWPRAWVRLRREAAGRAARRASSSPTIPNRDGRIGNGVGLDTPASAVAVAARAARRPAIDVGDVAGGRRGADGAAARRPDQRRGRAARAAARRCRSPTIAPSSRRCRRRSAQQVDGALGRAGARSVLRRAARFALAVHPLRQRRRRHPAGARLQHRSEGDLSRSRPRAAARLSRLLCLAARRASAPTRSSISASTAISNGCRARRWRCRQTCWPEAALGPLPHLYPVHRQRSGRGQPGQAARRGGHRRSPDAADDARRELRPAAPSSRR